MEKEIGDVVDVLRGILLSSGSITLDSEQSIKLLSWLTQIKIYEDLQKRTIQLLKEEINALSEPSRSLL